MKSSLLSMDSAGRVVLPKPVRERLHLTAGTQFEMVILSDGLELKRLGAKPSLSRQDGLLVHEGLASSGLAAEVERLREERLESV